MRFGDLAIQHQLSANPGFIFAEFSNSQQQSAAVSSSQQQSATLTLKIQFGDSVNSQTGLFST
jgi:hypothetical protein